LVAAIVFFNKTRSVQCVRVDGDLHVGGVGHVQAVLIAAGVVLILVQLQADDAGVDLFGSASGRLALLLPENRFIGKASAACSMRCMFLGRGVGGGNAGGRAVPPWRMVNHAAARSFNQSGGGGR
jgi:hypothetical protein